MKSRLPSYPRVNRNCLVQFFIEEENAFTKKFLINIKKSALNAKESELNEEFIYQKKEPISV